MNARLYYEIVILLLCWCVIQGFWTKTLRTSRSFPEYSMTSSDALTDGSPQTDSRKGRNELRKLIQTAVIATVASGRLVHAAEQSPDELPKYLERTLDFAAGKRSMTLYQGFAVNKGKTPATGGGDRTGTYTWSGGIELASALLKRSPVDVKGKRVIDLGTGTGVTGIAAAWAGASEVAMTDGAAEVLEVCALNINKNIKNVKLQGNPLNFATDNQHKIAVGRLSWGDSTEITKWLHWKPSAKTASDSNEQYDVVIATEVAYERKSINILLSTITALVKSASDGGIVLLRLTPELTDNSRGLDYFLTALKEAQLDIIKFPDIDEDNSQLLQLVRKSS